MYTRTPERKFEPLMSILNGSRSERTLVMVGAVDTVPAVTEIAPDFTLDTPATDAVIVQL